jgi:uncharacterized protein (DUF1330 family)
MSQPAYLIVQLNVKDFPQYREQYGKPVVAQLTKLGAEFLVTSPHAETLEGEWSGNWTVLIRFPSWETALEWYKSADYAPLKRARIQELTDGGNLVLLPGRDPDSAR